ncbi:MAG: hypothetical protein EXX96DRAFT_650548 [Benjaminiella poitrasii]|nr:MAG: hypothetical protein EXX96DRAFT_650548 [Benjaminiella poitrasii]
MPRQNPFLRRASSPGDVNKVEENLLSVPQLPNHPAKLTQASMSDSALKVPVRPSTFKNVQSRMISVRPSRFIKASAPTSSTSSPLILNDPNNGSDCSTPTTPLQSSKIASFIRLFDTFTQKIYMEGYLMKHNYNNNSVDSLSIIEEEKKSRTKIYVELSGSTLTLWDTEVSGPNVIPSYFQIVDTTSIYHSSTNVTAANSNKNRRCIFTIQNKKNAITFEATDELSMKRWISAVRLSCFEKQKLHQLFTFKLLMNNDVLNLSDNTDNALMYNNSTTLLSAEATSTKNTLLQVRVPGTSIWQKYWVVIVNKKKDENQFRTRRFGKKLGSSNALEEQILLYETKKSKTPSWTLSCIKKAYAIYPESPQLVERGSMIRIECKIKACKNGSGIQLRRKASMSSEMLSSVASTNYDENYCWFMADRSQLTIQWLLSVYDAFKLYGRPENLLNDPFNDKALNFGEPMQEINTITPPKLFLEIDDVVQVMDTSLISQEEIERLFYTMMSKKLSDPTTVAVTRRPTGARANSLPLITVVTASVSEEDKKINLESEVEVVSHLLEVDEQPSNQFKFSRQIADSSDESDNDEDEEDEEDEEPDSDDEPIGKKSVASETTTIAETTLETTPTQKTLAESLIPNFDFGNGFDVPKDAAETATVVDMVNISQTVASRGDKKKVARRSHSISTLLESENRYAQDEDIFLSSFSPHTRKASMPATFVTNRLSREYLQQKRSLSSLGNHNSIDPYSSPQPLAPSASMFGDFNLDMNFKKFLDEPLDQRKYSLPSTCIKLSSMESSRSTSSSNHRWENDWDEADYFESEDDPREKIQHPYDDDYHSYNSDFDGPLIPSLGDHFAPQNSLLDNHLGEQLSAKEQIEYCKATGQPLIQVSTKKYVTPQGGLVGMISQREKNRKNGNGPRVAERVNQHHAQLGQDRLERERERRLFEQRQQQFMKHQIMMYANGYGVTPISTMYPPPFIGPMPPASSMAPLGLMAPLNQMNIALLQQQQHQQIQYNQSSSPLISLPQQQFQPSPMSSPSSSPHISNYGNYIRPVYSPQAPPSPIGFYSQGRQSPSLSASIMPHSNHRRFSRPLLDEFEESGSSVRTISPVLRKSPAFSTFSGTSSVRS